VRVRFGVWDHFERRAGIPLDQQFQQKIKLLQEAEELGFVGYHIAEHHLTPLDMAPSPNVFLAALAQATTRLRIGTMVYILPLYHPVRLPDAALDMPPMQRPYPPLWYAGGIDFAGRHHLNFLTRTAGEVAQYWALADQHRGEPNLVNQHLAAPTAGITRHVVIRPTVAEAEAVARRAWVAFQANFNATPLRLPDGRVPHADEDFDHVLREGTRLLVGTPAIVRDFVSAALDELEGRPNCYLAPALQWGDMTLDESRESMRLFATEVMHAFAD
jgi:alkanesulfonate monooxygenase SsuD/methylene tetrahydromethanopterin reductase-like flavin-dependent oxidoreductase (luciferase family)